ncbi:Ig domain-containing protein [Tahibacter harae]|uniref:Ig domain-containing protein n=1 Tax=Tahibacter harae TaxID=2963937 RepID=A0ABT1QRQ6_9GAMM|nr:Ig domain-containing protein [Tahibacter harae]MCQ4164927.1 Ig domain-containing protein [Tahibacter harae]
MKKTLSVLAGSAALFAGAAGAQCLPANVAPGSLPNANILQSYTPVEFSVSAGGTYQYTAEGLPDGLSLSSAGILSGTPTPASLGSAMARIVATDGNGCVASRALPITVGTAACVTLNLGEVRLLDPAAASDFCVNSAAADSEYTLIPVNTADSAALSVSTTANNIVPVTGPPTPIAPDSGALAAGLAPLTDPEMREFHLEQAADLPDFSSADKFAQVKIQTRPQLTGGGPPAVDQILDIQAAPGCSGTLDMRKGRVEAVSPVSTPAKPRLYLVQEVIEQPAGSGTYVPAVPGGFSRLEFEQIRDIFDGNAPGTTAAGGVLGSSVYSGGRDSQLANFGEVTDLDSNGGVVVFFTRALNELSPPASSSFAPGAFETRDLFSADPGSCPRSNEGEYLYMMVPDPTGQVNSNVRTLSFVAGNAVRTLMHHHTHLVNASRRMYVNGAPELEEPWLDEGLAWISEELLFFNSSFGLTTRSNIQLADLTTGPNASRRVAAFNSYINPRYSNVRSFYLQNPTTAPLNGVRVGPLRRTPFAIGAVNQHESQVQQDAVMGHFLRYAADRLGGSEASFFTALTNATTKGIANLQARLGADPNLWARDMAVASYVDDAVAGIAPEYTHLSWNYRSVYGGLGGFPMATVPLSNGVMFTGGYGGGGGPRWLRFGVTGGQAQPAIVQQRTGVAPMPATSLTAIVRTK